MTYSRTRLTSDTTFYASPYGSGTQDGLSAANSFAGVQNAWDWMQDNIDLNGYRVTIQLGNGSYSTGLQAYGDMIGRQALGGGPVIIQGDPTAQQVTFNTPNVNTFSFDGGAKATLQLMTISAAGASPIYATNGGILEYGSIIFGTASTQVFADSQGMTVCTGSCSITQGATFHIMANGAGAACTIVPGVTLTLSSGVGFGFCFAFAGRLGRVAIPIPGVNFSGSCTGQKAYASLNGVIDCAGGVASLPGVTAAGSNYGGQVY